MIDYDHSRNIHTLQGPRAAFPEIFRDGMPDSVLDVGCGAGTWLKAAMDLGIDDLMGVDGISIPPDELFVPNDCIRVHDLTSPWELGRRFDAALCLEVAEHLDACHAGSLLDALTAHSDIVVFSAACPGQPGQHHVNSQWPAYWQKLFNDRGYACFDAVRWRIWDIQVIEPWYRQNMFTAWRAREQAGKEPRIPRVIHPEILPYLKSKITGEAFSTHVEQIGRGRMPVTWYLTVPLRAAWAKASRRRST